VVPSLISDVPVFQVAPSSLSRRHRHLPEGISSSSDFPPLFGPRWNFQAGLGLLRANVEQDPSPIFGFFTFPYVLFAWVSNSLPSRVLVLPLARSGSPLFSENSHLTRFSVCGLSYTLYWFFFSSFFQRGFLVTTPSGVVLLISRPSAVPQRDKSVRMVSAPLTTLSPPHPSPPPDFSSPPPLGGRPSVLH